ncbi:helix-turn-helix transcriptional regulator [Halomonas sp. TRM85114]|uniref:helix-turn-helix domain-containing protein n=1 Tax=Halomonas jincaotanensis TaxID=2810616 RepID=UPI001BD5B34F|nr:helix-turn-helix transcriptional regulator [Halomonas jincaotanensis]MBS9405681.1 helix-turn-helix transcriptional regulator [Halomonas jincaotanensis]
MWTALLRAAKRHHGQVADRGLVTLIARDAGVSKAAVSDWKKLGNYPEASTLRRLADLYRVSAEELSGFIKQIPECL